MEELDELSTEELERIVREGRARRLVAGRVGDGGLACD
jgi:hypothetical protein